MASLVCTFHFQHKDEKDRTVNSHLKPRTVKKIFLTAGSLFTSRAGQKSLQEERDPEQLKLLTLHRERVATGEGQKRFQGWRNGGSSGTQEM